MQIRLHIIVTKQNREDTIEHWRSSSTLFLSFIIIIIIIIIIIYSLTARVVGAPQMISQPVSSILPCSQLPSRTWRTPGLSIPWCCPPTFYSVCLVVFPLSLCLARWFWSDLMNGKTWTYYCGLHLFTFMIRSSCDPIACWILARTSSLVLCLCMRRVVSCGSTSFPWLVFFFGALWWGSMIHKHTLRWMWQRSASVVSWNVPFFA